MTSISIKLVQQGFKPSDYLACFGDFLSGLAGSFFSSLAAQPLQTLKIRQELSPQPIRAMPLLITMVRTEGPISLLKGLHSQLISGCLSTAVTSLFLKFLRMYQTQQDVEDDCYKINYLVKTELLGSVIQSLLKCPAELVTVRMRVKAGFNAEIEDFPSCLICATKIWKQFGLRAFWKGTLITLVKQGVPAAVGVSIYETICRRIAKGKPREDMSLKIIGLCGSIAGASVAIINSPVDVIKTHFQVDPIQGPKFNHYTDCIKQIYKNDGPRGFFKGLGVSMINEAISSAMMTVGVAFISKSLKKMEQAREKKKLLKL